MGTKHMPPMEDMEPERTAYIRGMEEYLQNLKSAPEQGKQTTTTEELCERINAHGLEESTKDTRMAGPSDGRLYDYRKMRDVIEQQKRPMTEEEASLFRIR
jgi:hypothetical protein